MEQLHYQSPSGSAHCLHPSDNSVPRLCQLKSKRRGQIISSCGWISQLHSGSSINGYNHALCPWLEGYGNMGSSGLDSHGPWSIWGHRISVARKTEAECGTVHKNNRVQMKDCLGSKLCKMVTVHFTLTLFSF